MTARSAIEVWAHPDVMRLERELAARVRALRASSAEAFDPILVLVPSRRQMLRVREMLAGDAGALLGVEVLTHQTLAYRLVETDPERPAPALASHALRETLVELLVEARRGGALAGYVGEHPAAMSSLTGVLGELREAGVTAEELARAGEGRYTAELAAFLGDYEDALTRLAAAPAGWTDRAGLARLAARAASGARVPMYRAVFQYGAYELIGMNLELVRALPAREPKVFLVPGDVAAPAWRYALRFFERHLGITPRALPEDAEVRVFVGAARAFREPNAGAAGPAGRVAAPIAFMHTQGPEAELNAAARAALRLIGEGVPPHEIAIVARTLDPYAALAETVFQRHSLPVDSSATLPLSRHPKARAFVLLVRALADGFERQTMVDLLRSPFLRHDLPEEKRRRWRPDTWDRWSRRYAIVSGASAWTEDLPSALREEVLPAWLEGDPEETQRFEARRAEDVASAETLASVVQEWVAARATWRACRTGAEHARFLRALAARWIRRWNEIDPGDAPDSLAIRGALAGILDELESLDACDAALADSREGADAGAEPLDVHDVLGFVETSVDDARLPWPSVDGVRFLDVMQARGLTFRHLFLIGFNADLLPRRPREDLFLRDRLRERLRAATTNPLAVRREAREEEWLLFAMTVSAAIESLTVIWQRADAEGKTRTVSLFLRELARVAAAPPDVERDSTNPVRVPTHPARAAEHLIDRYGLLSREEAALLAADLASDPHRGLTAFLEGLDPDLGRALGPGIALARSIEEFEGDAKDACLGLRYDGYLPDGLGWERHFSASSLRTLARCPQTFFFGKVLGVRPLEDAAEEYRFGSRELGSLVHEILERVYRDLDEEKRLRGKDDPAELKSAGLHALRRRWKEALAPLRKRMHAHYPVLFEHAESLWRTEIEAFLAFDLDRLAREGCRLKGTEVEIKAEVPLARGGALLRAEKIPLDTLAAAPQGAPLLPIIGVFDRVVTDAAGSWLVSDYKTAGNLDRQVDPASYLTARDCQAPLYVLLAEAGGAPAGALSELLGVGPDFLPEGGAARSGAVPLDPETFEGARAGFEETLGVLAVSARRGRFPFSTGGHCDYCEYTSACRRFHYPSCARVEGHEAYATYFATQAKTKTRTTLADVRGDEEEDA
jgi:inactivated superfamily I helicase/RecB family exonuclease